MRVKRCVCCRQRSGSDDPDVVHLRRFIDSLHNGTSGEPQDPAEENAAQKGADGNGEGSMESGEHDTCRRCQRLQRPPLTADDIVYLAVNVFSDSMLSLLSKMVYGKLQVSIWAMPMGFLPYFSLYVLYVV